MTEQITSLRKSLFRSKNIVALAGAGLSAASGIPTFRGAEGLWRQHDAMSLATPEAFRAHPSKVWQFYHYRREMCLKASPNAAHRTIALLQNRPDLLSRLAPDAQSFHFVTQNVDGLSIRADRAAAEVAAKKNGGSTGSSTAEGQATKRGVAAAQAPDIGRVKSGSDSMKRPIATSIIEMHGSLFRTICLSCRRVEPNFDSPIAASLAGTEDISASYQDIPLEELPHCRSCGKGLTRPGVVWFGESIPTLPGIFDIIEKADLILVLGTSSTVYPAAGFANQVKANGGRVAVFNVERTGEEEGEADWFFESGVEEWLPAVMGVEEELGLPSPGTKA